MSPDYLSALAARWWVLVVRGAAAIVFGLFTIVWPTMSLLTLALAWGAYAVVEGGLAVVLAARGARDGRNWNWLLLQGSLSLLGGLVAFVWPGMTAALLLTVIALWAVATGIAELAAAVELRRQFSGEWLLAASGALSIVFGMFMLVFPGAGALALLWLIGGFAAVLGGLLIELGVRLNRWRHAEGERHLPTGGTPTHA